MPKFIFKCNRCSKETVLIVNINTEILLCPSCDGGSLIRQLPNISKSTTKETVNKYLNIKHLTDQEDIIKKRNDDHYWKNEVPRLVGSGVYSEQTCFENNWIYRDLNGEIKVRTSPPED